MPSRKLVIGPLDAPIMTIENPGLISIPEESSVSLIGKELAVDLLEPVVEYNFVVEYDLVSSDGYKIVSSDGYIIKPYYSVDLRKLPRATKLTYYVDNRISGEFFSESVKRVGDKRFQIKTVSPVGLMDKQPSVGGHYTGQLFKDVLHELLGDGYNYTISDDAAAIKVYGILPYATKRKNLHELTAIHGVNILRSDSGGMLFTIVGNSTPEAIAVDNIYIDGSVEYGVPASRVEVTEHAFFYLDSVAEETVYDNTRSDAVSGARVTFKQPIYPDSLRCSEGALTIDEAGVNYAVVSGLGVLVGKPYTHTTRIVARDNPDAVEEYVVQIKDSTLVTVANSDNVCLRLAEYYFNATTVYSDIVLNTEKCGRRYRLLNAFNEPVTGFLTKVSASASNLTKASCEFIQNYVPRAQGSTYTHVDILPEASGVWKIPQEVLDKDVPSVRVVLIGGGQPGTSGTAGENGGEATTTTGTTTIPATGKPGKGGAGGAPGEGGVGGKIYSITLDVTGMSSLSYGRSGKNTFLKFGSTTFNSDDGVENSAGFLEIFSGTVYALPGHAGQPGGKGGDGGLYKPPKYSGGNEATAGENVSYNGKTYSGGAPGSRKIVPRPNGTNDFYYGGNGGGGAAVGANGKAGAQDSGGDGAKGAKGDSPAALYGSGGNGGNGGGGGGGAAVTANYNFAYTHWVDAYRGTPGVGGGGGAGSDGYQGAVFLYY